MRSVLLLAFLLIASSAQGASNYNRAKFYWEWVPDTWTKYFRVECGTSSGNYTRFGRTAGATTSLNVWMVLSKTNGTYYCIARGANDSDTVDPFGDASNEIVLTIEGNWVYPQ